MEDELVFNYEWEKRVVLEVELSLQQCRDWGTRLTAPGAFKTAYNFRLPQNLTSKSLIVDQKPY